jgi:hypothetical protein
MSGIILSTMTEDVKEDEQERLIKARKFKEWLDKNPEFANWKVEDLIERYEGLEELLKNGYL